jgi:hypothetical protein
MAEYSEMDVGNFILEFSVPSVLWSAASVICAEISDLYAK